LEAWVTDFDRMPQGQAVNALGKQFQEGFEVVGIERFARHELPVDWPELVLQFRQTARQEALDRFAGVAQHFPVRRIARRLDGEDEGVGRFRVPLGIALGLRRAIVCAVDFYGSELPAGVLEFALARMAFWVEGASPWVIDPSPDADPDNAAAFFSHKDSFIGDTGAPPDGARGAPR